MSSLDVKLWIDAARHADEEVAGLENWLRHARIDGLRAKRETSPIRPDEMGGALLPILTIILSSTLLGELVKSLHGWLTSRRRHVVVEIELSGRKIRLENNGPETVDDLLRRVEGLLAADPRPPATSGP